MSNGASSIAQSRTVDQVIAHAPAKINLVLEVAALRAGEEKHRLDSVFCTLALSDTLVFSFVSGKEPFNARITVQSPDLDLSFFKQDDNTLVKAVEQFKREYGLGFLPTGTLEVQLIKSIPAQAGLGGGSSNAAAMLRMLCWLAQVEPLSERSLAVARAVGADVPFFLYAPKAGLCARMGGYGDELLEVLPKPALFLALVKPVSGVSTQKAYAAFDQDIQAGEDTQEKEGTGPAPSTPERMAAALRAQECPAALAALCANNLEPTVTRELPQIASIKRELSELSGVLGVALSGSGSTLFALCTSTEAARASAQHFAAQNLWAVSTQT
jgi:4-diphosphocytidyl-2-C-methyl-D-erythritol kinase